MSETNNIQSAGLFETIHSENLDYKTINNNDVHAWSKTIDKLFGTDSQRDQSELFGTADTDQFNQTIAELIEQYPNQTKIFQKIQQRHIADTNDPSSGGYFDSDLSGLNVSILLIKIWDRIGFGESEIDSDLRILFQDILDETNQTCTQGDSHRFLQFYMIVCDDLTSDQREQLKTPSTSEQSDLE